VHNVSHEHPGGEGSNSAGPRLSLPQGAALPGTTKQGKESLDRRLGFRFGSGRRGHHRRGVDGWWRPDDHDPPFNGTTVNVVLGDYVIQGDLKAPAGNIRLEAINQGGLVHNVGIRGGPISGDMQPGKGFTLDVGSLAAGTYQLYCDIPDHVTKGMVANLVIT